MQDEQKIEDQSQLIDELENAYKQTISPSTSPSPSVSSLADEKQKITNLLSEIGTMLIGKKGIIEKKLTDLKSLKSEIETGLDELKKIETKKVALEAELVKIENIEKEEREIESEVANISTQI